MSRIDSIECQFTDIEWYGVDDQGNIAVFLSAGVANVPEFVCESRERTESLEEYFDQAEPIGGSELCMELTDQANSLARELSAKGLFYFDADDGTQAGMCNAQRYYTKHAQPERPLKYMVLPNHVQKMLKHNRMNINDFATVDVIHVEHAYK